MAKLIVSEFVSLDGVMEAPGGEPDHPHTGWVGDYGDGEHMAYKFDEVVVEAESHLLGRVTYESFAGAWPTYEGEMADKMNAMPKYVVSSTLPEPLEWNNSTVLEGDAVASVTRLKQETAGPILVAGSRTLVHTLLENDLVDELRLMVFPVLLGVGFTPFPANGLKKPFELADVRRFDSGVAVHCYRRA